MFSARLRNYEAAELAPTGLRAGHCCRQHRLHQRGLNRVDENCRLADLPKTVPHHPQEEQHAADAALGKLHTGGRLQYPSHELIRTAPVIKHV